ncbi:MAG: alpha/beta fold hydrolase [Candidatus Binatia bacterium]
MDAETFPQPSDRYLQRDGLTLHYGEWGDPRRETLILVHGNRDQCRSWDFFLAALFAQGMPSFHAIALDLRGHGDSDWSLPTRGYQHEDFVLDLAGLVHHVRKDSVTLIGHSLGGSISMLFAGSFPTRVKKLVLIEAVGPHARSDDEIPDLLARWLEGEASQGENSFYPALDDASGAIQKRFPLIPDGARAHMVRYGTKPTNQGYTWKYDPRVRFHSYSTFSEGQIRAFIDRIQCPTLLIFGSEGGFVKSPRFSRVGLFKNGEVVQVPGSGHHLPHEKPVELAEVIAPFLCP